MIHISPTDFEIHLFHEGNLQKAHDVFGSHVAQKEGNYYTTFTVWAPQAMRVNLVGSFNGWNGEGYELHKVNHEGIWRISIPLNLEGTLYKYEIESKSGEILLKSDPYAFYSELRPSTASIVYNLKGYSWEDASWMKKRKILHSPREPIFIYELHFGTWKRKEDGSYFSYREMAQFLIPYVKEHGFTHIEILPLVEHPFDRSWGYQGVSYFSPTSRFGSPHDLMYFIDQCHQNQIGVILDWVPGHFCKDEHGLYMFDGSPTYDYLYPKDRENVVWGTANFDLAKNEVHSFLISNAFFWMNHYHIDGFRMDAVANMLYWNGNEKRENPHAATFIKKLNETLKQKDTSILLFAEDSTDWPGVTLPTEQGGLGFSFKWNMGWMNDILEYMETEPDMRKELHHKVTFSLMYAFTERYILPFSHDEVVHGKKSLLNKMPGSYEEKFAQLRLLYGFMIGHPGKKLLFMGGEFGQFSEWKDLEELDWKLFDYDMHKKMNAYVKRLIDFYRKSKPLNELDFLPESFQWIDVNNYQQSIFSFIRKGRKEEDQLVFICNFKNIAYEDYKVGVPLEGEYKEVWNSDHMSFGGLGHINSKPLIANLGIFHGQPYHISMRVPPFGVSILKPVKKRRERRTNGEKKVRGHASSRGKRK
ncbi:1,4-alpha-glucan branching protein GlgB [Peribacillus acanthi]|uniref:1,4-alpha-glucan branching protein GlgB n=1 Tax=Peribacillus acanthi TaxID=2171554 RepID=UPI000D3E5166|nr:1,4-alpha-glucan branching protein GlgB [Peribacillus acanthi]